MLISFGKVLKPITEQGMQDGGHRTAICRATGTCDWGKAELGQLGPQMLENGIKKLNREWTQPWFLEKVKMSVGQHTGGSGQRVSETGGRQRVRLLF